jgi:hypothetical protein
MGRHLLKHNLLNTCFAASENANTDEIEGEHKMQTLKSRNMHAPFQAHKQDSGSFIREYCWV